MGKCLLNLPALTSSMAIVNTECTAGNRTWKLNAKVLNVTEETAKNDTLEYVGFTMTTAGVNLVNFVHITTRS